MSLIVLYVPYSLDRHIQESQGQILALALIWHIHETSISRSLIFHGGRCRWFLGAAPSLEEVAQTLNPKP